VVKNATLGDELGAVAAPPLAPDDPIDFEKLASLAQGNSKVMCQLLETFATQTDVLTARMASEAPKQAGAHAHTLASSARSVGAWKVAESATEFERVALGPPPIVLGPAMSRLATAITDTHNAIGRVLSARLSKKYLDSEACSTVQDS
jgi:HPt (histidine-containing phosphotransfer) domain-containing protein